MKRWLLAMVAVALLSSVPAAAEAGYYRWRCWGPPVPRAVFYPPVPVVRPYAYYYRPPVVVAPVPYPAVAPIAPVPYGAFYRGYYGPRVGLYFW